MDNSHIMSSNLDKPAVKIDNCIAKSDIKNLLRFERACQNQLKTAKNSDRVRLNYFLANINAAFRKIKHQDKNYLPNWEKPESISEILALRSAICEPFFQHEHLVYRCQIRTNLGNCLYQLGRVVEAIEQWNTALYESPKFAMALGNRADGLVYYGRNLYDKEHTRIFLAEAKKGFERALNPDAFWDADYPEAIVIFEKKMKNLQNLSFKNLSLISTDYWARRKSKMEIKYRKWCFDNVLFLNPLNDLNAWPIATRDIFHLPNHSYHIDDEPYLVKYYNMLKQELIGARALYFEYYNARGSSFLDRDILLFDHFDSTLYGLKYVKLKLSFSTAYSIFDKIAVFINEYFKLGKKTNSLQVSFRRIWYKDNDCKILENKFLNYPNWSLQALFSLSKDLFDQKFQVAALPDAQLLDELRNESEHRFLSIHDYNSGFSSTLAHRQITISDFEEKALRILKLARAALIYLSLAVGREEELRQPNNSKKDKESSVIMQGIPLQKWFIDTKYWNTL